MLYMLLYMFSNLCSDVNMLYMLLYMFRNLCSDVSMLLYAIIYVQ